MEIFTNLFFTINKLLLNTPPNIQDIFGQPSPPPGGPSFTNPLEAVSGIVVFGIRMFLIIGGLTVLFYLLWGAYDWITSGSEEEKLSAARQKITNAIIGIILMVVALSIFTVVSGDILGLIQRDDQGNWRFSLPTINQFAPTPTPQS